MSNEVLHVRLSLKDNVKCDDIVGQIEIRDIGVLVASDLVDRRDELELGRRNLV